MSAPGIFPRKNFRVHTFLRPNTAVAKRSIADGSSDLYILRHSFPLHGSPFPLFHLDPHTRKGTSGTCLVRIDRVKCLFSVSSRGTPLGPGGKGGGGAEDGCWPPSTCQASPRALSPGKELRWPHARGTEFIGAF